MAEEFTIIGPENADIPDDTPSISIDDLLLLSCLAGLPEFCVQVAPYLDMNGFMGEQQRVVAFIQDYVRRFQDGPTIEIIALETGVILEEFAPTDPKVVDFVRWKLVRRAKTDLIMGAQGKTNDLLDAIDKVQPKLAELDALIGTNTRQYNIHTDMKLLLKMASEHPVVPTGIARLDELLDGGVTQPSINVFSAGSGDGKSNLLLNVAVEQVKRSLNTIIFSLELPAWMIGLRLAAMATDTSIKLVQSNEHAVIASLERQANQQGKLILMELPNRGTTVARISEAVAQAEREHDCTFDVIVIDYFDLLYPSTRGIKLDNQHMKDKFVSSELMDFAHDPVKPRVVWTAAQQVKGAREESNARQSGVSGGVDKVNAADNVIVVKQVSKDGRGVLLRADIVKARSSNGYGQSFPMLRSLETMKVRTKGSDMDEIVEKWNSAPVENTKAKATGGQIATGTVASQAIRNRLKPATTETKADVKKHEEMIERQYTGARA